MNKQRTKRGAIVGNDTRRASRSRKLLMIIACIVLVVIFVLAGLWVRQKLIARNQCGGASSSKLYDRAAYAIKNSYGANLKAIVEEIEGYENYVNDPNCLYPVTEYYIYTDELQKAEQAFKNLERTYNPDKGLAQAYRDIGVENIDATRNSMEQLRKLEKEDAPDVVFWGIP